MAAISKCWSLELKRGLTGFEFCRRAIRIRKLRPAASVDRDYWQYGVGILVLIGVDASRAGLAIATKQAEVSAVKARR